MRVSGLLVAVSAALACGPWFPSTIIDQGDAGLLAPPTIRFRHVLEAALPPVKFMPKSPPALRAENSDHLLLSLEAEETDLRAAGASDEVIAAYRKSREHPQSNAPASAEITALPREFALYAAGARSFRASDYTKARESFSALLELPETDRRFKTVWAAYMLGKCAAAERDHASAANWFARTRELALAGFVDSTGLAAASFGEEGRIAYQNKAWLTACEHYLRHYATGDTTAASSLEFTAIRALVDSDPEVLASFAASPGPRAAMTAHLLGRAQAPNEWGERVPVRQHTQNDLRRWLVALEKSNAPHAAEAAPFALIAYSAGAYDDCARWLELAPADHTGARWLRIKLALRDGRVAEATKQLATLVHSAYSEPGADLDAPQLHGELAQLRLATRDYADALRLLVHGGYWEDAAYVAERILTTDELVTFIANETRLANTEPRLQTLLGRRLVRAGRTTEAASYFSDEDAAHLAKFTTHLQAGRDSARPALARGLSLAEAARTLRAFGLRLRATELEPDNAYAGGSFPPGPSLLTERVKAAGLAPPSDDEITRAIVPAATPNRRFHYRYQAADLAWEAAQLLPDNSTELVNLLMDAGNWLKARDPQAADRFYKALVNRCPDTDLGRDAKRLRWFPSTSP